MRRNEPGKDQRHDTDRPDHRGPPEPEVVSANTPPILAKLGCVQVVLRLIEDIATPEDSLALRHADHTGQARHVGQQVGDGIQQRASIVCLADQLLLQLVDLGYKVFLDLLAIRTILAFIRHPLAWFAGIAGIAGLISLAALAAFVWSLRDPAVDSVVFMGLCVLFGALMIFLLFLGVLGVLIFRFLYQPVKKRGILVLLFTSVGVAYVINGVVGAIAGTRVMAYDLPPVRAMKFGGVPLLTVYEAMIIGFALLAALLIHIFLTSTWIGKSIRAVADNYDLARVRGFDPVRTSDYVWFIASALAGLAGVFLGIIGSVHLLMGWQQIIIILAATVLGGLGSIYGVMLASMLLGIGMELGISVASAALRGEPTGAPVGFFSDVIATTKRALHAGDILDGEGGFTVWGKQVPASASLDAGLLPLGLAHDVKLLHDVEPGQLLKWSDVELKESDIAVAARRRMEAAFDPR